MIEQFRTALKAARDKRGMSARELSEATGGVVTRATIANWESGRKEGIDVQELIAVAKALDVPALSLLYPRTEVEDIVAFSGYRDDEYRAAYAYIDARESVESLPFLPDSIRDAMSEQTVARFNHAKEALYGEA
ncbi:helix-turn-helix domain-containing protein [Gordonia lacunae]|uniref:helix-turn-helix domain-containing protein n=1 Tax=Gordonia lacunae TaxID=417102 RepID=UPI0039E68F82